MGKIFISVIRTVSYTLKKITGINDISLFRKKCSKQFGKLIFHKKYSSTDLIALMCQMGMKKGSLVCIHSSMMQFYNYNGSAEELIEGILNVIGPEGTLMMPSFPAIPKNVLFEDYIFDIENDKTGAGYLAETFRKYPGVKRSFNVRASACAIGPLSEYLLNEHNNGNNCWDKKSPWFKLCEKGGLVFTMGLPFDYMGTFYHSVESVLKDEHPYWAQFFTKKVEYRYIDKGLIKSYVNWDCDLYRRTKKRRIMRLFTSEDWCVRKISNLEVKVFYTANLFPKLLDWGRKGITSYYSPSPKEYTF